MRVGIADHLGWAVAVTASDHEVVDRRRIELIEPGVTPAPVHYVSSRLDVAATAALVAERADEVLHGPRARLGPPWTQDHRVALAATIVAGEGCR